MDVRWVWIVVVLAVGLAGPGAATAAEVPVHQRMYLLAAPTDYLYWGADPTDPELGETAVTRTCPNLPWGPGSKPCFSAGPIPGTERLHQILFAPAMRFDTDVSWTAGAPLRFHLELDVESPLPYTVHLTNRNGAVESPAATQVAPGVFEGVLVDGGPITPGGVDVFGVRIRTQNPRIGFTLHTAGRSWFDLPQPAPGRTVPQLIAAAPPATETTSYATPQRTLHFNDSRWSGHAFTGDLRQPRTFTAAVPRPATTVYAWMEAYDTPLVHDAVHGRTPDARKLTSVAELKLLLDGVEIGHGANRGRVAGHATGRGVDTAVAMDVAAGTLSVAVDPLPDAESDLAYTVHVLVIEGERTLQRMRWRFHTSEFEGAPPTGTYGAVATCPGTTELVPATAATRSFVVDLDWDAVSLPTARWTLSFGLPDVARYPCGELGTGDRVRFTYGNGLPAVWSIGPTPSKDALFTSYRDTTFTFDVRFIHAPPAAAAG